ncbi:hypothetical protein [Notoacmeibacter sp. MSK16QG-6]|uniref:hypothetical protein n=1 Tax=Notoacmeibacter sp. MSK16QG-6 TaxID=2957982 RepID=UPI0020A16AA9|nr:hypothetical protein [Notoacmeibacter sp. MSK16QG-6]MCP1200611.1 hypothetical protein [Notoacmeibacter sp. MSK16QG-6]
MLRTALNYGGAVTPPPPMPPSVRQGAITVRRLGEAAGGIGRSGAQRKVTAVPPPSPPKQPIKPRPPIRPRRLPRPGTVRTLQQQMEQRRRAGLFTASRLLREGRDDDRAIGLAAGASLEDHRPRGGEQPPVKQLSERASERRATRQTSVDGERSAERQTADPIAARQQRSRPDLNDNERSQSDIARDRGLDERSRTHVR